MGWRDPPFAGEVWRSRKPVETRTVVDRTLGGDVVYVSGRFTRFAHRSECTEREWMNWIKGAEKLENRWTRRER